MTTSTHSVYTCWYSLDFRLHTQLPCEANLATKLMTETMLEFLFVAGIQGNADDLEFDELELELLAVLCDCLCPSVDNIIPS